MKHYLSIIIVSKNSMAILPKCLNSIAIQNYGIENIEVILVDGGSIDGSKEYAKQWGARVIDGGYPENQEARRYIGIKEARGEIIVFIDSDNFIPDEGWINKMVSPFHDEKVSCSFTKWYGISSDLSSSDNYYALMGGNDPISYFLKKNDRVSYASKRLPWGANLIYENGGIQYVRFSFDRLPTLGCNGFFIRAKYLKALMYRDPEMFFHIDAHVDMLKMYPEMIYALVETSILHATGKSLLANLKKRISYKKMHTEKLLGYRKYAVYDPSSAHDNFRIIFCVIFGLTFVVPILHSIIGYIKTRRLEWFYHPIALPLFICAYAYGSLASYKSSKK